MNAMKQITEPMSRKSLADKVTWEGGAFDALRYGIRSRDIADDEVAQLWQRMEALYEQIAPLAWRIEALLDPAS
jgi:hypothetical protein